MPKRVRTGSISPESVQEGVKGTNKDLELIECLEGMQEVSIKDVDKLEYRLREENWSKIPTWTQMVWKIMWLMWGQMQRKGCGEKSKSLMVDANRIYDRGK